ncbi:MAG: cell division protein FtsA [Tannerella sp.]|jgi:cell division protein FtsA|nr:cell division protein FtsA [Tannerella sp.]
MAEAKYIVVIDMETSRFVGMVGKKNEDGTVSVVTAEEENAGDSVRRGNVYHRESTGMSMKRLVEKLKNKMADKLPDYRIEKVYVGVGGQSLHSIGHVETKHLSLGATVSENDLRTLDEQCRAFRPEMDVAGIAPPVYYVDGKRVEQPKGLPGGQIEARYKLIVGRPVRNQVAGCMELARLPLAGLIVSPLALAGATLGREEKEAGCVQIGFHAGVTSVAVYRQGTLAHLSVIPLSLQLITGDLMKTLNLSEPDAEWLKTTYGLSLAGKGTNADREKITIDGREIDPERLNALIEGRVKEIVENVYKQVELTGDMASLGAGIVLAGRASGLKKLPELLQQRFKMEVSYATVREEYLERNSDRIGSNPDYMTAVSLLIQATENCLQYIPPFVPEPIVLPEGGKDPLDPFGGSSGRKGGKGGKGGKGESGGKDEREGEDDRGGLNKLIETIKKIGKGNIDVFNDKEWETGKTKKPKENEYGK